MRVLPVCIIFCAFATNALAAEKWKDNRIKFLLSYAVTNDRSCMYSRKYWIKTFNKAVKSCNDKPGIVENYNKDGSINSAQSSIIPDKIAFDGKSRILSHLDDGQMAINLTVNSTDFLLGKQNVCAASVTFDAYHRVGNNIEFVDNFVYTTAFTSPLWHNYNRDIGATLEAFIHGICTNAE
ncbi:hypothetical protein [Roseovarius sp. EL26]|uniref:hypothetical protein n=1 Tax=Roseovarius sp. EL26 TaxID=2126672 RepID=UPI000EA2E229|nr:hypothetical protein [Roseovarius sp. EL26]